ncbi:MAG: hypothetical protein C4348_02210, partial [Patescibacteria group bacterium]
MKKITLFLLFLTLIFGFNFVKGQTSNYLSRPTSTDRSVCIQVITPAKNPLTGECREFPTPCDVPPGWEKVESCKGPVPCILPTLKPGMRDEKVKVLQKLLSEDKSLYPEGLITGYYGRSTQEAVKRLQRKLGLEPTGVFDEKTAKAFWPCPKDIEVKVLYPNGGERLEIGKTYEIKIEINPGLIEAPYHYLPPLGTESETTSTPPSPPRMEATTTLPVTTTNPTLLPPRVRIP